MTGMTALMTGLGSVDLVELPDFMSSFDSQPDPVPVVAGVYFDNNGTAVSTSTGLITWRLVGASGDYEIRATIISGSPTSGNTLNVWHSMASDVYWQCDQTGIGSTSAIIFIEIRLAGGGVLDSTTADLLAEVT